MTPQELKNSILQMAIQGKLVEQRPEEGTAEELYQQIQEEKQRLVKEGKIKKEKALPEISEDEKPFEIPESWKWVRPLDVTYPVGSKINQILAKEVQSEGKYPAVSQSASEIDGYCDIDEKVISDLPLVMFGDHTRNVKYIDFPFVISADGTKFLKSITINASYLFYWTTLSAFYLRNRGYARHYSLLVKKLIPLPPLAEQKRIASKIEELLPHIDRYEQAWSRLKDFNKRFPDDMKKSILQLAIQGKLVEQRPEEGTAEELYQQIQAEKQHLIKNGKIKKEKPLPEISEDEKPFEIPKNWEWVRLGDVITLLSGTDFKPDEYNEQGVGIPYITGASSLSSDGVLVNRWTEKPKVLTYYGDVLLVCKGSGYGKAVFCNIEKAHIARQIMAIKKIDTIYMQYIRYFLMARITQIKSNGQGVIPGIDRTSVLNMVFPLPPLAEQKRIVARLEKLLPLCKMLK